MPFWEQRFFNTLNEELKVSFKGEKVSFQTQAQKDFAFNATKDFCTIALLAYYSISKAFVGFRS